MWKRFNKTDRRILSSALVLLLLFSYFLYDDSLLFSDNQTSNLTKIGSISFTDRDVRRKISKQFVWKTAKDQEKVFLGDSLFTGKNSSAKIKFDTGKELVVQQNSLISFSKIEGQFMFDLQFGKISGEIKGTDCIKILVSGKPTEICGENAKLELDADGSVNVLDGKVTSGVAVNKEPENVIEWSKTPSEKFYHFNHLAPMKLSWTAKSYFGRYHVQFSKDQEFKNISYQQISQVKQVSLKNYPTKGKFFVRIQADNIKGEAAAYSAVRTTEIQEVQAPVIVTPTLAQTLTFKLNTDGEFIEPNRTRMTWTYHNPKSKFELQLATDPEFKNIESTQLTTGLEVLSPALSAGEYHLRVREADLEDGSSYPWSQVTSFSVKIETPEKMAAPVLLTTDIKYFGPDAIPPKVRWTTVPEASKYVVEVSASQDFSEKQTFETASSNIEYKEYYPGDFYVRVFGATDKGTLGESSKVGTMLIRARRPVLNPVEPKVVMGKTPEDPGDPQDFDVTWSEQKFAESYLVQVSKDPDFKDNTEVVARTPASVLQVPQPGDFFWRVQGLDSKGKPITKFSEVGQINYTLKVPLAQPDLLEPINNITLFFQKSLNPYFWFEWKAVRQASIYKLEISTTPTFEDVVFTKDLTATRLLVKEKLPQGDLYWRVRAESDANRLSHWTPPRKMSIYSGRKAQNGGQ